MRIKYIVSATLVTLLAIGLCSCESAPVAKSIDESNGAEGTVVVTPLETVANADDVGFEVIEATFFSDEEIAGLVESLQSEYTYDLKGSMEHSKQGIPYPVTGYRTESTELSVARGIPAYDYVGGVFEPEPGDSEHGNLCYYVFDEGVPIYRMHPWQGPFMFLYNCDEFMGNNCPTTEEVFAESTTKEFCLIRCAQGNVLYDGVRAWLMCDDRADFEDLFDPLDDDMASTPGIEDLELGTILERQTFLYESPTD